MKIVTKDNFDQDYFTETLVVSDINEYWGKAFVKLWNDKNWDNYSNFYLELVEDDYELYDGLAELI